MSGVSTTTTTTTTTTATSSSSTASTAIDKGLEVSSPSLETASKAFAAPPVREPEPKPVVNQPQPQPEPHSEPEKNLEPEPQPEPAQPLVQSILGEERVEPPVQTEPAPVLEQPAEMETTAYMENENYDVAPEEDWEEGQVDVEYEQFDVQAGQSSRPISKKEDPEWKKALMEKADSLAASAAPETSDSWNIAQGQGSYAEKLRLDRERRVQQEELEEQRQQQQQQQQRARAAASSTANAPATGSEAPRSEVGLSKSTLELVASLQKEKGSTAPVERKSVRNSESGAGKASGVRVAVVAPVASAPAKSSPVVDEDGFVSEPIPPKRMQGGSKKSSTEASMRGGVTSGSEADLDLDDPFTAMRNNQAKEGKKRRRGAKKASESGTPSISASAEGEKVKANTAPAVGAGGKGAAVPGKGGPAAAAASRGGKAAPAAAVSSVAGKKGGASAPVKGNASSTSPASSTSTSSASSSSARSQPQQEQTQQGGKSKSSSSKGSAGKSRGGSNASVGRKNGKSSKSKSHSNSIDSPSFLSRHAMLIVAAVVLISGVLGGLFMWLQDSPSSY